MDRRSEIILEQSSDPFLCQDMMGFICGKLIGQGTYRDVFEYNMNPKWVVKVQRDIGKFNNILEFEIWCDVRWTDYKKHFAPCHWMSEGGRFLLQSRTTPISNRKKAPEKIPYFFSDVKESNFGFIGKDFVAHDYDFSLSKFISSGLTKKTKLWKPHNKENR